MARIHRIPSRKSATLKISNCRVKNICISALKKELSLSRFTFKSLFGVIGNVSHLAWISPNFHAYLDPLFYIIPRALSDVQYLSLSLTLELSYNSRLCLCDSFIFQKRNLPPFGCLLIIALSSFFLVSDFITSNFINELVTINRETTERFTLPKIFRTNFWRQ